MCLHIKCNHLLGRVVRTVYRTVHYGPSTLCLPAVQIMRTKLFYLSPHNRSELDGGVSKKTISFSTITAVSDNRLDCHNSGERRKEDGNCFFSVVVNNFGSLSSKS